jgi:hypothetical protein
MNALEHALEHAMGVLLFSALRLDNFRFSSFSFHSFCIFFTPAFRNLQQGFQKKSLSSVALSF